MKSNLTPSLSIGRGGYDCMECLEPVKRGDPCIRLDIAEVKIVVTVSKSEEAHVACAERYAAKLRAALDKAKVIDRAKNWRGDDGFLRSDVSGV